MPDITDPVASDTQPDPPPRAARGVPRPVIIDFRGSAGVPADQQAPLGANMGGHPPLFLHPGLQPVDAATWAAYLDHKGIAARVTPVKDADGYAPAPSILVVDELPRRLDDLCEAIARTWSTAGVDMLAAHEATIRPNGARAAVTTALATQRRRLARRTKKSKGGGKNILDILGLMGPGSVLTDRPAPAH